MWVWGLNRQKLTRVSSHISSLFKLFAFATTDFPSTFLIGSAQVSGSSLTMFGRGSCPHLFPLFRGRKMYSTWPLLHRKQSFQFHVVENSELCSVAPAAALAPPVERSWTISPPPKKKKNPTAHVERIPSITIRVFIVCRLFIVDDMTFLMSNKPRNWLRPAACRNDLARQRMSGIPSTPACLV